MGSKLAVLLSFVAGFLAGCKYFKMKYEREQARAMADSANKLADSSLRVEAAARKTGEAVSSVGPSTSTGEGNKLLGGQS